MWHPQPNPWHITAGMQCKMRQPEPPKNPLKTPENAP